MTIEEIETRLQQIPEELKQPDADLDKLQEEVRSLTAQREELRKAAKEDEEKRRAIAEGLGTVREKEEEKKPMSMEEIRSSEAYVNAYANYIKTGDDRECRTLVTTNASGTVPVPVLVDEIVRTAWEHDEILQRVRKTNFRGNLKVAFEYAADPAYVHTENSTAPTEESLTLGIVTMTPANIKKWIRITDEVAAMAGAAFITYVYDEVTHKIIKKLADLVVGDISGASTSSGPTAVGVAKITEAPAITTLAKAAANLSEEATDLCVIMNRLTEVNFLAAHAAGNFAIDPFAGMTKLYTSALPAYDSASANAIYAIVGDLKGAQVNFPEGEDIIIKWDELTEAEKDLIKIVARLYAAHAVTGPGRFTNIAKPAGT